MHKISLVIPAYNEAEGIRRFHDELLAPALDLKYVTPEIIYVNDGSRDTTLDELTAIATKDKRVKVLNLSRNFGKELATTAGITYASGDAIVILDADGQHPPARIKDLIAKWHEGAQVVVGVRNSNQKEGLVKKFGSKVFYKLFNTYTNAAIVPRSTDFRLIDRVVQQEFVKCAERNRITRGLIDWLGFKRDYIYFDSPARLAGEASYKTSQLFRLALNSFVSLSLTPLFIFGWVGVAITVLSVLFGLFILIEQFLLRDPLALHFSGSVMLGDFIALLVGLVLISQAILATYISHIHTQAQSRPLFIIDPTTSVNLNDKSA